MRYSPEEILSASFLLPALKPLILAPCSRNSSLGCPSKDPANIFGSLQNPQGWSSCRRVKIMDAKQVKNRFGLNGKIA